MYGQILHLITREGVAQCRVSTVLCSWTQQLYCIETLHLLGHTTTPAMQRVTITWMLCISNITLYMSVCGWWWAGCCKAITSTMTWVSSFCCGEMSDIYSLPKLNLHVCWWRQSGSEHSANVMHFTSRNQKWCFIGACCPLLQGWIEENKYAVRMLHEKRHILGEGKRRWSPVQTNRKSVQGTAEKWPFHFQWYTYKLIVILRRLEVFWVQQNSFNPVCSHLEILCLSCKEWNFAFLHPPPPQKKKET